MADSFYAVGSGRDFVVFNDQELTMEEVSVSDLEPVEIAKGSAFTSAAWSCNCSWYFIIADDFMLLFNTYSNRGFLCRKKSAMFIEMFLSATDGERPKVRRRSR